MISSARTCEMIDPSKQKLARLCLPTLVTKQKQKAKGTFSIACGVGRLEAEPGVNFRNAASGGVGEDDRSRARNGGDPDDERRKFQHPPLLVRCRFVSSQRVSSSGRLNALSCVRVVPSHSHSRGIPSPRVAFQAAERRPLAACLFLFSPNSTPAARLKTSRNQSVRFSSNATPRGKGIGIGRLLLFPPPQTLLPLLLSLFLHCSAAASPLPAPTSGSHRQPASKQQPLPFPLP